jgi:CheY-like chemotaxis protein
MTDTDRQARILLVDDNRMDVELTLDAFEQAHLGNEIEVVRTGQQALDRLLDGAPDAARRSSPLPDLILLDLKMPGIDGIEVLRRIKQAPTLRRIPVVVLTSSREEGDRAMAYDAGANSYLVKPLSFEGFVEVVHRLLDYWFVLNIRPPDQERAADDLHEPLSG